MIRFLPNAAEIQHLGWLSNLGAVLGSDPSWRFWRSATRMIGRWWLAGRQQEPPKQARRAEELRLYTDTTGRGQIDRAGMGRYRFIASRFGNRLEKASNGRALCQSALAALRAAMATAPPRGARPNRRAEPRCRLLRTNDPPLRVSAS